jgi:hypothetical protein
MARIKHLKSVREDGTPNEDAVFMCPACDDTHVLRIIGKPFVWEFNGDDELPTFSPSVLVTHAGGYGEQRLKTCCHSYVRNGRIEYLGDCTHKFAGQTIDLPEIA